MFSGPFTARAVWMVLLDASTHKGPYTITASLAAERASINDVLFGDVWLCSGQSNMEFTVDMVKNSTSISFLCSSFYYNGSINKSPFSVDKISVIQFPVGLSCDLQYFIS